MDYCEVCGVLIANTAATGGVAICERCLATRRVVPETDSGLDRVAPAPAGAAERIQFPCPSCKSILQLPPVKKRTKIKCPRCAHDFAMTAEGKLEQHTRSTGKLPSAQEKLLEGLKVERDLDDLLERVPEKKAPALPSVLDSGRYEEFRTDSGSRQTPKLAALPPAGTGSRGEGYALLPNEPEVERVPVDAPLDLADAPEPPAVETAAKKAPTESSKSAKPRIATARRKKDDLYEAQRKKAERSVRAAEAQKYTLALLEKRKRRTLQVVWLAGLLVLPLIVMGVFLISTTAEGGFAVRGGVGRALTDLGEVATRGVQGGEALVTGK
jgi:DNA-directed RNA polymerase subunit M/transcription elongation factor TFIIS